MTLASFSQEIFKTVCPYIYVNALGFYHFFRSYCFIVYRAKKYLQFCILIPVITLFLHVTPDSFPSSIILVWVTSLTFPSTSCKSQNVKPVRFSFLLVFILYLFLVYCCCIPSMHGIMWSFPQQIIFSSPLLSVVKIIPSCRTIKAKFCHGPWYFIFSFPLHWGNLYCWDGGTHAKKNTVRLMNHKTYPEKKTTNKPQTKKLNPEQKCKLWVKRFLEDVCLVLSWSRFVGSGSEKQWKSCIIAKLGWGGGVLCLLF